MKISLKRFITVFTAKPGIEDFVLQPEARYIYQEYIDNKLDITEVSYRVAKRDLESEDICFLNLIDKERRLFAGAVKHKELHLPTHKSIVSIIGDVTVYIKRRNTSMSEVILAIKDKGYYIFLQEDEGNELSNDPPVLVWDAKVDYTYYEYEGKVHLMNINFLLVLTQCFDMEVRNRYFLYNDNLYYKDKSTVELEESFKIAPMLRGILFS